MKGQGFPRVAFRWGKWCGRRDLNSYDRSHQILSLARLPFRHVRVMLAGGEVVTHPRLERGTP